MTMKFDWKSVQNAQAPRDFEKALDIFGKMCYYNNRGFATL